MALGFTDHFTKKLATSLVFLRREITANGGSNFKLPAILIVLAYLILFLLFVLAYRNYIVVSFGNNGFIDIYHNQFNIFTFFAGLILVLVISTIIAPFQTKLSHILLHFHFMLPIIPMIVLYSVGGKSFSFLLAVVFSFLILFVISQWPVKETNRLELINRLSFFNIDKVMWVVFTITLFYVLLMVAFGALDYLNFKIWEIYDHRREASANLPAFFSYLSPITSKALLPILLIIALHRKTWWLVGFACALAIFIFATTGHKLPLLTVPAIIGLYILLSLKRPLAALLIAQIMLVMAILYIPGLGKSEEGSRTVGNILLRRIYFTPANINFAYYDYFIKNPKVYWSNSKLSLGLIKNPYHQPIPNVIGKYQFKKTNLHANTGWLGMGFAHYGYIGMFIYALIIGFFIRFSDVLLRKTSLAFAGGLLTIPYLTLFLASDIPTMLLTHGLFVVLAFAVTLKPLKEPICKKSST